MMNITNEGKVVIGSLIIGEIAKYNSTDDEISSRVSKAQARITNAIMRGDDRDSIIDLVLKENRGINRIMSEDEDPVDKIDKIRKDLESKAEHADIIFELFPDTEKVNRVWGRVEGHTVPKEDINPLEVSLLLMDYSHKVLIVIYLPDEKKYHWAVANYDKEEKNKLIAGHPVTKLNAVLKSIDEDHNDAYFVVIETEEDGVFLKIRDTIHGLTEPKLITQEELDQAYDLDDIKVFRITELSEGVMEVDVTQKVKEVDEVKLNSEAEFVQDFKDFVQELTRIISEDNAEDIANELLNLSKKLSEITGNPLGTPAGEVINLEKQELFSTLVKPKVEDIIKDIGDRASKADIIIDYFSPLDTHFILRDETLTYPLGSELSMDKVALLTMNSLDNIVVVTEEDEVYELLIHVTDGNISFG